MGSVQFFLVQKFPQHGRFQRVMNKVISGLEDFCLVNTDDLVIMSDTWDEHIEHIRFILN